METLKPKLHSVNNTKDYIQMSVFQELYKRLVQSVGKDIIILKGSVLLANLFEEGARLTWDLDCALRFEKEWSELRANLSAVYTTMIIDYSEYFNVFRFRSDNGLAIDLIKDGKIVSRLDISMTGASNESTYTAYVFGDFEYTGQSINKILADKFSVIISKKVNRRPKDLYDAYLILQSKAEFDFKIVFDQMTRLRGYTSIKADLDVVLSNVNAKQNMKNSWNGLNVRKLNGDCMKMPSFGMVMNIISYYIEELKSECEGYNGDKS